MNYVNWEVTISLTGCRMQFERMQFERMQFERMQFERMQFERSLNE